MGIKSSKEKAVEIFEVCHDIGLLWNKYLPDLNFGHVIFNFMIDNPDLNLMSNAELLDRFREWIEERG